MMWHNTQNILQSLE